MDIKIYLDNFYDEVTKPVTRIDGRTEERTPPAYLADKDDWVELMMRASVVDGHLIYANTLSVLQHPAASILISIFVLDMRSNHFIDQNATLRFDQGVMPRLCGLSRDFLLHDEVDDGEYEVDCENPIPLTVDMERAILKQLSEGLKEQFGDEMFKDHLSSSQQKDILDRFEE